ncbi:MAG: RNA-binding protein [Alphaproteobacteria bacterium]|nr:RNA-binding protein [Alphaproteobacteria bacterium]
MLARPAGDSRTTPGGGVHPRRGKHGHEASRRCLVTGESRDRGVLLRFVVGPDGRIVPDVDGRLPGRGLWLTPTRDIVKTAVAKRVFARAAKQDVVMEDGLDDRVEALLVRRSIECLGLARRAGRAVAGFTQVEKAVRDGGVAVLVEAADGSPDGRGKLTRLAPALPVTDLLTAAELGQAFTREHVVHAALLKGRLAESFIAEQTRLAGFRNGVKDDTKVKVLERNG